MNYSIDRVAESIRKGDRDAYTFLFRELYAPLVSYSVGFTGEREASEDIVQQFFLKLWEERRKISSDKSIKSYVYVSVRNLSLNHIRDRRTSLNQPIESCSGKQIETEIFEEEVYFELYRAINLLPERCREIFMLKLAGNDNREIAAQMGISEDTVRSQLRHGRGLARTMLARMLLMLITNLP